jgi:hypothetical protein
MATIHCYVQIEQALEDLGLRQGSTPCSGGVVGGEANIGANVGDGAGEVYRDKTGVTLNFRTLKAMSGNISIVVNGDVIEIDSLAGGGNITGPNPSTLRGVATYANTTGTLLYDNSIRIDTALGGPPTLGSPTYRSLQAWDDSSDWRDMIQLALLDPEEGGGTEIAVGSQYAKSSIIAIVDPTAQGAGGRGKIIHEAISTPWSLFQPGTISLNEPNTARVFTLRTQGTNGGEVDKYVGDIDPTGVVTAKPGSMYYHSNGVGSKVWQHRGASSDNSSWVELTALGAVSANEVSVNFITGSGPTPWDDVQDTINVFGMAGASQLNSPHISDAGGATIDIASGKGVIRTTDSHEGDLYAISWAASTGVAIPTDTTRYIGIEYVAAPTGAQIVVKTSDSWNRHSDFRLGTVVNDGGTLHILNNPQYSSDVQARLAHRFYDTRPLERAERIGGIIPGGTGRYLTVSGGELYDGMNEFPISSIDTSGSDTFDAYYRKSGGGWNVVSGQTQWDNANWDDGTGTLNTLGGAKWAIHWLYIEADSDLVLLYGQGEYSNEGEAAVAPPPSDVPPRIDAHGRLLGRLIFQNEQGGASTYVSMVNVWEQVFAAVASAGDVFGPGASETDNAVVFDGTTGKLIKGSGLFVSSGGLLYTQFADTVAPTGIKTQGTNGAASEFYVGNRDPIGNVTGNPGDTYTRVGGTNSRVYQHRGSTQNNTDWVDMTAAGGASLGETWSFSTSTSGDPGSKKFLFDHATQTSASNIHISATADNGMDFSGIMMKLVSGDTLYVQQGDDSSRYHLLNVTGTPTDNTTYVVIPISFEDSGSDIQNNKKCPIVFLFSGGGGGSSTFGSEHQYAEVETASSTSSTAWQTKATLTTPSLPSGDYIIQYQFEFYDDDGEDSDVQVLHETTTIAWSQYTGSDPFDEWYSLHGGFKRMSSLSGVNNFYIQYRAAGAVSTCWIRRARLRLYRVS